MYRENVFEMAATSNTHASEKYICAYPPICQSQCYNEEALCKH